MLGGIIILAMLYLGYLWISGTHGKGPIGHAAVDGDQGMSSDGRRGSSGDGGSGGKKKKDDPDSDDDISKLTKQFASSMDLRNKKQREADEHRRKRTQCSYIGWFPADEDDPPELVTERNRIYRQCRKDQSVAHRPHCHIHRGMANGDPNDPREIGPRPPRRRPRRNDGDGQPQAVPNNGHMGPPPNPHGDGQPPQGRR